jgi:SOS-response transcriptional repressor LexA
MSELHPIQQKLLTLNKVRRLSTLSYREIGRQVGTPGKPVYPQAVKYHIDRLITRGQLNESDRPASVSPQLISRAEMGRIVPVPFMGSVNAGPATLIADDQVKKYIGISSNLLMSKNYPELIVVEVKGNSMNMAELGGELIEDGDYVVVDRSRQTPHDGEIVIVNNDNVVNIKRISFNYNSGQIKLSSESNEHFDPIYLTATEDFDSFVEGTVIQVLKNNKNHGS